MKTAQEVINILASLTELIYIAMDKDGKWHASSDEPFINELIGTKDYWDTCGYFIEITHPIQPVEDWTQSLLKAQL